MKKPSRPLHIRRPPPPPFCSQGLLKVNIFFATFPYIWITVENWFSFMVVQVELRQIKPAGAYTQKCTVIQDEVCPIYADKPAGLSWASKQILDLLILNLAWVNPDKTGHLYEFSCILFFNWNDSEPGKCGAPVLWRPTKSRNPYNVKPFLTDISAMVAQIQKCQKTRCIFFQFWFWEDPPHPVNWSPNTIFYRYLSNGRSNPKN